MIKLLCKNTLKGYNSRSEVINLFTEGWYYTIDIKLQSEMILYVISNDGSSEIFSSNAWKYSVFLYIYDWFYTPAESRQKQIDSIIN